MLSSRIFTRQRIPKAKTDMMVILQKLLRHLQYVVLSIFKWSHYSGVGTNFVLGGQGALRVSLEGQPLSTIRGAGEAVERCGNLSYHYYPSPLRSAE